MTGNAGRPRLNVRLLADLDAGLLDEATAAEVRAAAAADPAASAALDALAATRADLAALPDPPVPPALAARWSAALGEEQSRLAAADAPAEPAVRPVDPSAARPPAASATPPAPTAPPPAEATTPQRAGPAADAEPEMLPTRHRPHPHARPGPAMDGRPDAPAPPDALPAGRRDPLSRPPRRSTARRARWLRRPAVLAAVLLVVVGIVAALRARAEPPPTVERPQLVAEALSAVGVRDTAGLADPARRSGCLRAAGAPVESPAAPLLGGRRVTFEGAEGVLLVLGTGRLGAFDVLIVDPSCGPSGGKLLAATRVTPP